MANTKTTETTGPRPMRYGAEWDEVIAIENGFFFIDWLGVKHGLRPTSPDPVLLMPEAQPNDEEKAAEAAAELAKERYDAVLTALADAEKTPEGQYAIDMNTGKGFFLFKGKKKEGPATIDELRREARETREDLDRANVKLSRLQAKRADRIRQLYADQAQAAETPLQKAIREAQRDKRELTERELSQIEGYKRVDSSLGYGNLR